MTENSKDSRRRARLGVTLVGGVLAVVGVVAVGYGVASQDAAPPSPPAADSSTGQTQTSVSGSGSDRSDRPGTQQDASDRSAPSKKPGRPGADDRAEDQADVAAEPRTLDYSAPVRVQVPSLGVSSTLEDLALDAEGQMEVPVDPDKAGWFTPAPPPGVPGVSVIAGHVTWNQDPVVFYRLGDLRPGDTIEVDRADGSTAVFTVDRIGQFPKSTFPTKAVYTPTEAAELRLITCGGEYDEERSRYLDNIVVWATMTSSVPA